MEYLLIHTRPIVSAEKLIEHAWDSDADLFSNVFWFPINSLRKKLDDAGPKGISLLLVQGYQIYDP